MSDSTQQRPSAVLRALEGRAVLELGWFIQSLPLLRLANRGDGHSVLVLPGLGASDRSTVPLRRYLRSLGYGVSGWGLGRNPGPSLDVQRGLTRRLQEVYAERGRRVSLVGWSLGGLYARELARTHPGLVRQVVSLGSPFRALDDARESGRLSWPPDASGRSFARQLPVPSTAIYSKSDGITGWHNCREIESDTTDNVEVPGSHCGLGHNPVAVWVIADRLAQPQNDWRPFGRSLLKRWLSRLDRSS